jgi:LysM repeat protein
MPQAATAAAAAPTLAGVAAAICLSPQSPAQAAIVPASTAGAQNTGHTVTLPAAYQRTTSAAQLLAVTRGTVKQAKRQASTPVSYTVRPGDTLSGIAGKFYHNPGAWPVIYDGNHGKIRWANIITVGEKLTIPAEPAHIPAAPKQLAPKQLAPKPAYVPRHAAPATDEQEATVPRAPVRHAPAQTVSHYSGAYPGGAFGACVVARESGGNPNIWNASGHWGLYQFSYSTWVAYGGSPSAFGNASAAVQNQVFANALAQGGQGNWAPYDGC